MYKTEIFKINYHSVKIIIMVTEKYFLLVFAFFVHDDRVCYT